MNAKQLFERAILLLNYVDADGNPTVDTGSQKRVIAIINQIAADLVLAGDPGAAFEPIKRLDDALPVSGRAAVDAMPYGVAMLLAQAQGDAEGQALFATMYNRKRAVAGGFIQTRQNVLP